MAFKREIVSTLCFLITVAIAERVVMTNNGPVQGITVSKREPSLEAFLGIPFAEPPVGNLRFRRPVPKTSWMGVLDATKLPSPCIQNATAQYYYAPVIDNMTEDCLFLNMWIPYSKKKTQLKPVIVYVHGGAFHHGSANMAVTDGAKMASYGDVVVVTVNYRVGSMGFFSAFIEEADGNMGIYDILLATQWVKANVKSFGGDPDHIVLMGQSAGSMIIAGFLTSPMAKHLFKRVIMQSGSSLQTMILDDNVRLHRTGQRLASMLGCADKTVSLESDPRMVVRCLKRLPAIKFAEVEGVLLKDNPVSFYPRTGDEFLPQANVYDYNAGNFRDTEMLVGVNEEEGNIFLTVSAPDYFGVYGHNNVKTLNKRLSSMILTFIYKQTEQENVKAIADFYTGLVENKTSDAYTKIVGLSMGDYMITCNSFFTAEAYSVRNPVYFYVMKRKPSSSPLADWMGTTHFDEVQYLFGNALFDNFTAEEAAFSERLIKRWIAFAKTGNPNIPNELEWPRFTRQSPKCLVLDDEEKVQIRPDHNRCEFWRDRYRAEINETAFALALQSSGIDLTCNTILILASVLITNRLTFW